MTRLKIKIKKSIAKRRLVLCLRRKSHHVSSANRERERNRFVSIFSILSPREIQTILDESPYTKTMKKYYTRVLMNEVPL